MREELSQLDKARQMNKPVLPKRFYKQVSVQAAEGGFQVCLDGKPTRTPGGDVMLLPSEALATQVAADWDAQEKEINPALMPSVKLVNTAVEVVTRQRHMVVDELASFLQHDLVCYRAEHPQELVALQSAAWDEAVALCNSKLGIALNVTTGILSVSQPREAGDALRAYIAELNAFQLTGLHNITTLLTSVSLALCVFDGDFSAEQAWAKAHVDEDYNISQWGADYEAEQRRQRRWLEFQACMGLVNTATSER